MHGESVHLRAGQGFFPGLLPHGELSLHISPSNLRTCAHLMLVFSCRISSGPSTLVSVETISPSLQSLLWLNTPLCLRLDGDQCVNKPCKNGGMCADSVGGYDCICKSGFTGVHCENGESHTLVLGLFLYHLILPVRKGTFPLLLL